MSLSKLPALVQLIEGEVGGRFQSKRSKITVGTSATKLVNNNFDRLALAFFNYSGNVITLDIDSDITATQGIQLLNNGSSASFIWRDDLTLVGDEWYAVSSAAGGLVFVLEVVRYSERRG